MPNFIQLCSNLVNEMPELINGNEAAAYAAHYAGAKLIVGDSETAEKIKSFTDFLGRIDSSQMTTPEASSSSIDAAMASSLSGARPFITKNTDMKKASLARVPLVGISENSFSGRDSGAIIFLPENSQEVFDSIIMAYYLCEDKKILLPAIIAVDLLSARTREVVDVSTQKIIENFLPISAGEKPEKHIHSMEETVESKASLQAAMDNAKKMLPQIFAQWKKKFHRVYGPVEKFMTDDAENIIVTYGAMTGNAKLAAQKLREAGEKVGLLRIRMLRPFPEASLSVLKNAKKVAVVEPTHAAGSGGLLWNEIKSQTGIKCSNFICGKSVSIEDFKNIFKRLQMSEKPERIWMM